MRGAYRGYQCLLIVYILLFMYILQENRIRGMNPEISKKIKFKVAFQRMTNNFRHGLLQNSKITPNLFWYSETKAYLKPL